MSDAVSIWLHLLAVAIWIGPQVFLFAAAIPAVRTVEDAETRARLTRIMTTRFGWIGGGAVVVMLLTGIINLVQIDAYTTGDLLSGEDDIRFTRIFWEKMFLVALAVFLVGVHIFAVGPRQLKLAEQVSPDPAEQRNVRRLSIMLSALGLLASIGALYLGAVLGNHEYSLLPD
jgi:uncharacterized membrane protein